MLHSCLLTKISYQPWAIFSQSLRNSLPRMASLKSSHAPESVPKATPRQVGLPAGRSRVTTPPPYPVSMRNRGRLKVRRSCLRRNRHLPTTTKSQSLVADYHITKLSANTESPSTRNWNLFGVSYPHFSKIHERVTALTLRIFRLHPNPARLLY